MFREPSGRANGLGLRRAGAAWWSAKGTSDGGRAGLAHREGRQDRRCWPSATRASASTAPTTSTIDGKGRIYFTDPRYSHREELELDKEAVYRIDPDGKLTRIIDSLTRPNGIAVTRDGKTLYVADNASPGGVVTLWAFDLDARGDAKQRPRPLRLRRRAAASTAWPSTATAASGPPPAPRRRRASTSSQPDAKRASAKLATVIPMPEDPTNCTFGGKDRDILYVTTTASLFRIRTAVRGQAGPPGK